MSFAVQWATMFILSSVCYAAKIDGPGSISRMNPMTHSCIILHTLRFYKVVWDHACSESWNVTNIICTVTLQWRHDERDGVPNHQRPDCIPNRLFRRRSEKTPKRRVTSLCEGNSPMTGEFPAQRASNAEMFPFDDVIMV